MNWNQLRGKWKQSKGKVREKWGNLTDDDLEIIAGQREQFIGRVQERYGIVKEEAERQVDEFVKTLTDTSAERADRAAAGKRR